MINQETLKRAKKDKAQGKSPSTQAGEFVKQEIEDIRKGKHGARSTKQAIAIGLSQARRAGVDLPPPPKGAVPEQTRKNAKRAYAIGQGAGANHKPSSKRSRTTLRALRREGKSAASHEALSRQASSAAAKRSRSARSAAARKAVMTKGSTALRAAAKKAARTRKAA